MPRDIPIRSSNCSARMPETSPTEVLLTVRHLLLFDIDGTLLDASGAGRLALGRALASEFGVPDPHLEVGFAGRTDRAIASEALIEHGLDADEECYRRYLDAYVEELPESLAQSDGRVLPGVPGLLRSLHQREDVVLGILTGNMERAARLKLAHFELDGFFVGGGYGDEHHDRDDVAREALRALSPLCAADAKTWVIGDTRNDVRCARAIDARAVAVCGGFGRRAELIEAAPDHLLDDLSDCDGFLSLLDDA